MAFHPKVSGSAVFTDLTVSGTLTIDSLSGVLKASAGVVSGGLQRLIYPKEPIFTILQLGLIPLSPPNQQQTFQKVQISISRQRARGLQYQEPHQ